jgi:hypothetical protein
MRFLKRIKFKKKIQHNHEVSLLNSNPWYIKLKKSNNEFNQNKVGNISEIKGRKFLNDKIFKG